MAYNSQGLEQRSSACDHFVRPGEIDQRWVDILGEVDLRPTDNAGRFKLYESLHDVADAIFKGLLVHRYTLESVGVNLAEAINLQRIEDNPQTPTYRFGAREAIISVYSRSLHLQVSGIKRPEFYTYGTITPRINRAGHITLVESSSVQPINGKVDPSNFSRLGDQAKYCATLMLAANTF